MWRAPHLIVRKSPSLLSWHSFARLTTSLAQMELRAAALADKRTASAAALADAVAARGAALQVLKEAGYVEGQNWS